MLRTGRNLFCKFIPASGGFVCFDSLCRDEDTCYRFRESVPFAFGSSGWRDGFYNDLFNSCIVKSGKIDSDNTGRDCQFVYLLITRYQPLSQDADTPGYFKPGEVGTMAEIPLGSCTLMMPLSRNAS